MTDAEALREAQRRFGTRAFAEVKGLLNYAVGSKGTAAGNDGNYFSGFCWEDAFAQCEAFDQRVSASPCL